MKHVQRSVSPINTPTEGTSSKSECAWDAEAVSNDLKKRLLEDKQDGPSAGPSPKAIVLSERLEPGANPTKGDLAAPDSGAELSSEGEMEANLAEIDTAKRNVTETVKVIP